MSVLTAPKLPVSDARIVLDLTGEILAYLKNARVTLEHATPLIGDLMESLGYHMAAYLAESYE